jgi:predicted nucleotidyltransferase
MSLSEFDPLAVAEIRKRLESVRASGVRIGFAIESGSRAWGFPSPDSDYDCRFIYVRSRNDYLSLFPKRDVIEFPIVGDVDAGGWDLRKALLLALKGNAAPVEWVTSPIAYEEEPGFRERLKILLADIMVPRKVALHYVGLLHRHVPSDNFAQSRLKKLLYAVRPVIALRWMAQRDFDTLPPMNMMECLDGCRLPDDQRQAILDLVALKMVTREMGEGPVPAPITALLQEALTAFGGLSKMFDPAEIAENEAMKEQADAFFIWEIDQRI